MIQMTNLSILMSVYNEPEQYIREAIDSIRKQTITDWELIVVNDNPNRHDVCEIIDSYKDSRIVFVQNKKNIGLAMCMNKAASLSQSDVFVRMDADDVAEPNRLAVEWETLMSNDCDLVFSSYSLIDEDSKMMPRTESITDNLKGISLSKMIAINPTCIHHPTVMMRRSMFEKVGGYRDFPCTQDADLWLRMQENGCNFYRCHQPLLRYRVNSQSISKKKWYLQRLTWYYIFRLSMERLKTGHDTYSLENYNMFLEENGINDSKREARLRKAFNYLEKAKGNNAAIKVYNRIKAFLSHSLLRQHYFDVKEKQKVLNQ